MIDYYLDSSVRGRRGADLLPEYGVTAERNPGEAPAMQYSGTAGPNAMALSGAGQARRGPTGDVGSQVGALRNLEYSAGGRAHRISTGPYTRA